MLSRHIIVSLTFLLGAVNASSYAAYTVNNALSPSIPGSFNRADIANILPKDKVKIFYENPHTRDQPNAAFLTFSNLIHRTVVLEHISYVTRVTCSRGIASITFANLNTYSIAQNYWYPQLSSGLIIVTYAHGCGSNYPSQRSWLKLRRLTSNDETYTLHGEYTEIPPDQTAQDLDIDFGQSALPGPIVRITPRASISKTFTFGFTPAVTDQTAFGAAHLIGKYGSGSSTTSLYCVGCGASGSFTVSGHFSVKLLKFKLEKAELTLDGNVKAQLALAIIGAGNKSIPWSKRLITMPLSSFSIPLIVAVGPYITLDVSATANLHYYGGIQYGWALTWPEIKGSLDLKDFKGSASGFKPDFTQIFDVAGEAGIDLTADAKLGLRFGVDVLKGKWKADVGLVDQPYATIAGKLKKYSDYEIAQMAEGTVINPGLCYTASLGNKVLFEGEFGSATKSVNLATWTGPSVFKCLHTETVQHKPKRI